VRQEQKSRSRQKILATAAECFREQGYSATGISELMQRSGLTNGAFYAHFSSKSELLEHSACEAAREMRENWVEGLDDLPPLERIDTMLARYIGKHHRDHAASGCTMPTLGAEISRSDDAVRLAVEREVKLSLQPLVEASAELGIDEPETLAWSLLSLCVGAITLARAVGDQARSDRILEDTLAQSRLMVRSRIGDSTPVPEK
jgi:TetR/AcrR family transcriptional repressor of nem operon